MRFYNLHTGRRKRAGENEWKMDVKDKREKIGKNHYQKGGNMNSFKDIKSWFRRERPETFKHWLVVFVLAVLYIPFCFILLLIIIYKFILRIARKITGKKGEK